MSKPTAAYDATADAIAVWFAPDGVRSVESEEVAPGVVLDYDERGRAIGVELLNIRELVPSKGNAA
jgi:uncharacterized protein YuzE